MTAGFNTGFQPQYMPQTQMPQMYMPQGQYGSPYGQPAPAAQTHTQPQTQYQTAQPQSYPQNYYLPQAPGIINYVTPPVSQPQSGINMPAAQTQHPQQTQYAQNPQALSHIPYEQNPLTMDSGLNGSQNNMQNAMSAQMPAPNVQGGEQGQQMNALNNQPQAQPFMDIGVVNAPENFSKTPIIDDLNRRGQSMERESAPKLRNKKTFTLGNVSAACAMGSLGIILTMALCKILKLIKHK